MAPTPPTGKANVGGINPERQAIAKMLDSEVPEFTAAGVRDDLMLLAHMAPHMPLFHRLMELSGDTGMGDLCAAYPGLYRYAKVLERLAAVVQSGEIEVLR